MPEPTPIPRYAVLNAQRHRDLKVLDHQGYGFARGLRSVDLVIDEFERAAGLYPLVFEREAPGQFRPVALLAPAGQAEACVDSEGRWTRAYVPMALRYHPFALAGQAEQPGLRVCIDTTSELLSSEQGAPLFDHAGQPSAALAQVIAALSGLNRQRVQTDRLCRALAHFQLFTPLASQASSVSDSGSRFHQVDEGRLCRLADAELCVLRQHGWLRALYAHQVSLAHFGQPGGRAPAVRVAAPVA